MKFAFLRAHACEFLTQHAVTRASLAGPVLCRYCGGGGGGGVLDAPPAHAHARVHTAQEKFREIMW